MPWLVGCACLILTACAPPTEMKKRYFWPVGHPEPKIEYVRFLHSDRDVTRGSENVLAEAMLGRAKPEPLFTKPYDVASDGMGRVFVTDIATMKVLLLDLREKSFHPLGEATGGLELGTPFGLALNARGELYVADPSTSSVFLVGRKEVVLAVFGKEHLDRPVGIAVDDEHGRVYVADAGGHRVVVFDLDGKFLEVIGGPGAAPGTFNSPLDVAVGPAGELFVLDSLNARVQVFSLDGTFIRSFGERGTALGSFSLPKGIAVDREGHVYVADSMAHRFVIFDQQGNYLLTVGQRHVMSGKEVAPGGMNLPAGIDADASDSVWVVDGLNGMVHQFQFLSEEYLKKKPILPGQAVRPPESSR